MYTPLRLFLGNVLCHKATVFEFQRGITQLIRGKNSCDLGQKENGTGKSAILEGLSIAITGNSVRDVPLKDLIRDGEEQSDIQIDFFDAVSGNILTIHRSMFIKKSKSTTLRIWVNGKERDVTSVNHGNSMIIELLGIEKEDLYNYFLISKFKYQSFLSSPDGQKKKIIGRFSQADKVDEVVSQVAEDLKAVALEKTNLINSQTSIESKIEVYEKLILDSDFNKIKKQKEEELQEYKQRIEDNLKQLTTHQTTIQKNNNAIKLLDEQTQTVEEELGKKDVEWSALLDKTNLIVTREELCREKLRTQKIEKDKLQIQIADSIECPKCEHLFSIKDATTDVSVIQKTIESLQKTIAVLETELEQIQQEKQPLKLEESVLDTELKRLERELVNIASEQSKLKSANQSANISAGSLVKDNERIQGQLLQCKNKKIEDPTIEHKKIIAKFNEELVVLKEDILSCEEDIATYNQLKELYSQFKTYLTNQAIGAIEGKVNEYLKEVGTNLSLQLDGYTDLASGKVSETISATVLRNGIPEASYGRFSGGERMRIDIAIIVAMQRLINATSTTGGLDLLFLDEIIESGDSLAIEGALKALQSTYQTIQLVTFGNFEDIHPHVCLIEKLKEGYAIVSSS